MAPGGFVHRRLKILVPLRHRDFRLLWTGMTVSLLGDGIMLIALTWQVYELSDTPTALSMVGFAMTVPHVVLLLVGGAVSDRFERRKVMLAADLIRMVAVSALGLLSVYGHIELWHMMVLAAIYGAGTAFFGPAFDAIVPDLIPEDELPQANSLDQFVRPAAYRMIGPAIGGWLIAVFGGRAGDAFLLDGFTFAISVACLILIRPRPRDADEVPSSMVAEIKEGFAYVRTQTWLWGTFLAATLAYLIFWGPDEVLLPYIVKEELGRPASELGLIFALGGIGAMFSAVVMGNRQMPRRHMTFMYVAWTLSTLMVAGYGIATMPWQFMVFAFAFNALESAGLIVWITTKQRLVPGRLLGRVSSFDWFISIGLVPLSYAFAGPLAEALGARTTLVGAGLLGALVTIAFLFLPGMRAIERTGALAGADMELVSEPGLGALESPAPHPQAVPHGARPLLVDDDVVGRHQETLAHLREAIVRWNASRADLGGEISGLEREERVLEREIELARSRLVDVRTRLAVLRGLREHYAVAGHQVVEGLEGLGEVEAGSVPRLATELDAG
jgi:MFS family permease